MLVEPLIRRSSGDHLSIHNLQEQKGEGFNAFSTCIFASCEDIVDGVFDQNPKHALHLFSLGGFIGKFSFYRDQGPYFFLIRRNEGSPVIVDVLGV